MKMNVVMTLGWKKGNVSESILELVNDFKKHFDLKLSMIKTNGIGFGFETKDGKSMYEICIAKAGLYNELYFNADTDIYDDFNEKIEYLLHESNIILKEKEEKEEI